MVKLTEKKVLELSRASSLRNVKNLNCWGSNIDDLTILRKMPNLEVLNLSVNHVSKLEDIAFCPKLKELYLRKNNVSDLSEIAYLKHLPSLKVLWLSENQCTMEKHYKSTVLRNLPSLNKLDNLEIEDDEKRISLLEGEEFWSISNLPDFSNLDLSVTLTEDQVHNGLRRNYNNETAKVEELKSIENRINVSSKEWHENIQSLPVIHRSNHNVLSATLLLINELGKDDITVVLKEAEKRIHLLENKQDTEVIID